jgi:hypothetical protein
MDLVREGEGWVHLAQDRDWWWAHPSGSIKGGIFLTD